jgi:methanogenic corrinoid protein MtbC1
MAEALEDTDVYVITQAEFERFMEGDVLFSMAVTKELAQTVQLLADQVEELSLLDVQQRLERCLARLAEQYGVAGKDGIKIELGVTHQEIADMIAANRSTVTYHLNKLKQEGLLWSQGRHLVLTHPEHAEILRNLKASVLKYDYESAEIWARKVVEIKVDPIKALDALTAGIRQVDDGFTRGELGLPEIMGAAIAIERSLPIIEGEILESGGRLKVLGTVVIGTVHGDIHDIGKTMVSTLLTGEGFRVIDLGVDVSVERFIAGAREHSTNIVAISALMTTTAPKARKIIAALKSDRMGKKVKVMVGGGAISRELAEKIGADGYAPTARRAVLLARQLVTKELDS